MEHVFFLTQALDQFLKTKCSRQTRARAFIPTPSPQAWAIAHMCSPNGLCVHDVCS